ncbi:hypothetical protein JCM19992_20650 [Thermostilla marina]
MARRTLNSRFLLLLVAAVVLVGGVGFGVHRFQIYRNAGIFLAQADAAEKEENWPDALKYLQWYLNLRPDDLDAKARLGSILVKLKAYGQAYRVLEDVVRRDPERAQSRRELVEVELAIGRFRDALIHLDKHLLKEAPDDPELLFFKGRCQAGLGEYATAVATFREATARASDYREPYVAAAVVLRERLKRPSEADRQIEELVTANPDDPQAHLAAAQYYHSYDLYEKARQEAEAALQLAPDDINALLIATDSAIRLEDFDDAQTLADRILELRPDAPEIYLLLAKTAAAQDKPDEVISWLERGLAATDNDPELLWNLVRTFIDQDKLDQAEARLAELADTDYPKQRIDFVQALLLCARGEWRRSATMLERIRPQFAQEPDILKQIDFYLGFCYGQVGNTDQQMAAYQRAVDTDPMWAAARAGRAMALVGMGRINEALNEYRTLLQLGKMTPEMLLQMARLMVLKNLSAPAGTRDWRPVESLLSQLAERDPDSPSIPILRAEILVSEDQTDQAESLIQAAIEKHPDQVELPLALAALNARVGKFDKAREVLDRLRNQQGDSAALRLAEARLLLQEGKEDEFKARLDEFASGTEQFPREDRLTLLSGLAGLAIQVGEYAKARTWCAELAEAAPNNLRLQLLLFDLSVRSQDPEALAPVLDDIKRIEGEGPLWHYGTALRLFLSADSKDSPELAEAVSHLREVERERPNWYRPPWLRAMIEDLRGNEDAALTYYLKAIDLGDRSSTSIQRAVQLLYGQQRFVEADQVIRRMQERQTPFSSELGRLASDISLRLEEYDRALVMARGAATGSDDYRDHVWYATVLSVAGLRSQATGQAEQSQNYMDEAEKEFRLATQMAPKEIPAWVALIQFYARTNQSDKANAAIEEAQSAIPAGLAPLALAQCYEALKDPEAAERHYREALAASPDDPTVVRQVAEFFLRAGRTDEAESQLRRFVAGELNAKPEDVVWARRAMALMMAGRGGYSNLTQGLELIRQNLTSESARIQDQRAEAILLASHPKYQMRLRARKILEEVVANTNESTPQDRYILARLYMADRDVVNASRHMRALLAAAGDNPLYVRTYAQFLLEQGEVAEASVWTNRLEQLAPDDFSTVALRADILVRQKRYDDAIAHLKAYLDKPIPEETTGNGSNPPPEATSPGGNGNQTAETRPSVMELRGAVVGMAFERLAAYLTSQGNQEQADRYYGEAEAQYRRFIEAHPEAQLMLAAFLARRGRLDEAVTMLEEYWDDSDPALVQAATSVLALKVVGTPLFDRVLAVVLAAADKFERPLPLLMNLADMYGFNREIEKAVAVYQEILQRDPTNIVAINNLAVMLAYLRVRLDESAKLIDQAIKLAGPTGNLLDSRAIIRMARDDPRGALIDLDEAIADKPSGTLLFHKAQALMQLGRMEEAKQVLARAIEMGLTTDALHPLERAAFDDLVAAIGPKDES